LGALGGGDCEDHANRLKGRCQATEWQHRIWLRWKALIRRRQLDRDLADELQFHLAMAEEKRQAEGLAPEEARAAARRAFGNAAVLRETEMWLFAWLETLWQDLRYGSRMLGCVANSVFARYGSGTKSLEGP
jgi:hypothetical protein